MAHRDREDRPQRSRRRGQGELEVQVLAALRESAVPVTAAWVQERLGGDLAYTTVVTILTRLLAKDAVARERRGRSFAWTPTADVAGLAALKMRRLLDGEGDREAVLASFVTALSPDDEQVLRALLEAAHPAEPTAAHDDAGTGGTRTGGAGTGGTTWAGDEPGAPGVPGAPAGSAGRTED
ncbi:BlaI/MecI/CopY family transcriptional regulator [Streptomyces sp. NPDC002935]|uniref:BlaI/MecI/CopY family transcriptional regulator n=1 Tax=Streptomyces sp. NPDC002935 TaxID=3154545 RepID=UPI00339F34BD